MIITSLNLFLHVLTLLVGMLPPTWYHGVTYSFAFPVNTFALPLEHKCIASNAKALQGNAKKLQRNAKAVH